MAEAAENYISQRVAPIFRRQALFVWAAAVAVAALWLSAIVGAPILAAGGHSGLAGAIYHFFGFACHQIGERSFHLAGHQFAVCSRCFGVYFGLLAGIAAYPVWRSIDEVESLPRIWLLLSLVPIGIDWSLGVFGIWENTHLSRFVTGMLLGAACGTFIMPALVEIVRNRTSHRILRAAG